MNKLKGKRETKWEGDVRDISYIFGEGLATQCERQRQVTNASHSLVFPVVRTDKRKGDRRLVDGSVAEMLAAQS